MRLRLNPSNKKVSINYFNAFFNRFINTQSQSNIVKLESMNLLDRIAFTSFKDLYRHYLFEYYKHFSSDDQYFGSLEKVRKDVQDFGSEDENMFFDRIYSNLVLNNKIFEHEFNNIYANSSNLDRNGGTAEKYNSFKKLYLGVKKHVNEPVCLRFLILKFFQKLLNKSKNLEHKFMIKCLFGLTQINIEFKSHFSNFEIKNLFDKFLNFDAYKFDLVNQWIEIYLNDESDLNDLNQLIIDKFPMEIFKYESLSDVYSNHIAQFVNHFVVVFDRQPDDVLNKIDQDCFKFKPRVVSEIVYSCLVKTKPALDLNCLIFERKYVDFEYLKKNFYTVFEAFFINRNEKLAEPVLALKCVLKLVDLFKLKQEFKTENKSKILLNLIDANNSHFYLYQVLFKLGNLILKNENDQSNMLYYFSMFKMFVECFLLALSESSFNLFLIVPEKNQLFLYDFIFFGMANFLKICLKKLNKFKLIDTQNETFQTEFYDLCQFLKEFIAQIFNLYISIIKSKDTLIEIHDYSISCVAWLLFDYLNIFNSFDLKLVFMNDLNLSLFQNVCNLLIKYSKVSARFRRQLKFLFNQKLVAKFLIDTSSKQILMLYLNDYLTLMSNNSESLVEYEFEAEVNECLSSKDISTCLSYKYILCYLTSLFLIEYKSGNFDLDKNILNSFIKTIVKKLNLMLNNTQVGEIKDLTCLCLSMIGPVSLDWSIDSESLLNFNDKRILYLNDKFAFKSNTPIYSFYHFLCQSLFNYLIGEEYNLFNFLSLDLIRCLSHFLILKRKDARNGRSTSQ